MERELRNELNKITEIKDNIYPTNAPVGLTRPYLVYYRADSETDKTFEGYNTMQSAEYVLSIMALKYSDMRSITDKVNALLITLPLTYIGKSNTIYVKDIVIHGIDDVWESELGLHRGVIDLTIYY